jgi:hypothetical protein
MRDVPDRWREAAQKTGKTGGVLEELMDHLDIPDEIRAVIRESIRVYLEESVAKLNE